MDQVREKNVEILKQLLEALYLLVVRGDRQGEEEGRVEAGKAPVKSAGTYLVIRELHKDVEDEVIRENCERLVDVLMAIDDQEELTGRIEKVGGAGEGEAEAEDEEDKILEIL